MKNVNVTKILGIIQSLEARRITLCFRIDDDVIEPIVTNADLIGFLAAARRQEPQAMSEFLFGIKHRRDVARGQLDQVTYPFPRD